MHIIKYVLEVIGLSLVGIIILTTLALGLFGWIVSAAWGKDK